MRFVNIKVNCRKIPGFINDVQVVFATDSSGNELVFPPLTCNFGSECKECLECTASIWVKFKKDTSFIPTEPL